MKTEINTPGENGVPAHWLYHPALTDCPYCKRKAGQWCDLRPGHWHRSRINARRKEVEAIKN